MNEDSVEVLNIVQQVLRQFLIAVAASGTADLGKMCAVLKAAAALGTLDPIARKMLDDLGDGAGVLSVRHGKQSAS